MTMRLQNNTALNHDQLPSTRPRDLSLGEVHFQSHSARARPSTSTLTSASTSRHTSSTSIYSMPFHSLSRQSTPPTPLSSPGLFRPPSNKRLNSAAPEPVQYLHPSQYRQTDSVRETYQLETDFDPISGRKTINNYAIIDEIGRGTHGKVKLGSDLTTRELVAIKIVERSQGRPRLGRKGDGGEGSETKIRREIAILKKIRHENVVRLLEVIDDDRSKKVYLVLEYVMKGEVVWRQNGDPDVIRRDRQRVKREVAAAARAGAPGSLGVKKAKSQHRRRRKHASTSHWSLEFASDGSDASDESDEDSIFSLLPEDCFIPAMEIEEARRCFRDTVIGLEYLHWNGIVHRDIKPANLLWTDDKMTKISDFGVSFLGRPVRTKDEDEDEPTGFEQHELELAKTAGTPAFFAPELCSMDAEYPITCAIDVWALGVTLFCFIYGRLPFNADDEFKLFRCISDEELVVPHRRIRAHKPELVHHHQLSPEELEECETEPVDEDLRDLIKRLLTKNPNKRILLKEVKVHPWVLCGIKNPIEWLDKTDPEQNCHGTKIEVTTEDVEAAVSVPSIVTRAKAAFRKAAGTWVRGLRKRTSSSINVQDAKEKKVAEQPAAATGSGKHAQGQQNSFIGSTYDDPDKELQWMGGVEEPRDEGKLNKLAPAVSNSSTGSAGSVETVHGKHHEGRSHHWSMGGSHWPLAQPNDRKLRRKQSMSLLGSNVLGARRSTSRIRDPTHDAPITFKAEKVPPLLAPRNSHRVIRSSKSEDLRDSGPKMMAAHSEAKELRARDILNGALYPNPVESCDEGYDELPTNTPQPRSLYPVERINHAFLNDVPKTPDSNLKKRIDRQRRDEQEQARLRLGNLNIFDEDASDRPCPLSPDDETPINVMLGRENQRMKLEERERLHCVNSAGSLPSATPEGWSRESFYHPVRDWETAPIVMAAGYRNKGYFEPPSPSFHSQRTNGLVSSSSGEGFANTAGSSLTNSTSFPSIATNPSSVSSEIFLNHYSSKESSDPTNSTTTYCFDEAERKRIQGQSRGRKASELLFQPEVEDSGSESEGGFVFQDRRPKRTRSIAVGELARESNAFKDEALRRGSRPTRPKNNSRSSGSTVKMAGATLRGRRDQK